MENLLTDGSEFKLPNGRRYRGYYHIHPRKGAMVGATHTGRDHELLQPVNKLVKQKLEKMQTPSAPVVPPPARPQAVKPEERPKRTPIKPARSESIGY